MAIWDKTIDRRDFLKTAAGAAAAFAAASILPKQGSAAPRDIETTAIKFSEMQKLSPTEMAKRSPLREYGYNWLMDKANGLQDQTVKKIVLEGLKAPKPLILQKCPDKASQEACRKALLAAGYIKEENTIDQIFPEVKTKLNFWDAAGAGWGGHHAYPCGLITHVATDLQTGLSLIENYEQFFGYSMNRELLTEAVLLHDLTKPWILQWTPDHKCLPEIKIAGTGCHHIQQVADCMYRGLRPDVVVAVAVSHDHAGWPSEEKKPVGYIKAAAIIAGKDPIKEGYLAPDGETLPLPRRPESFLVHLGDHDFVLTSGISSWTQEYLKKVALSDYGLTKADLDSSKFYNLRNYVYSQASDMHLYQILVDQGYDAFRQTVLDIVIPG